uniref:DUF4743 domain-containing protein n=1 Tax=Oncorhynchus tshawytscha TaxID=74940 RepID=A0A8C8HDY0_ONCTS
GASRTTFLRFGVGGEQVGRVPCKSGVHFEYISNLFNPPHGGAISLCQKFDSFRRSEAVDSVTSEGRLTDLMPRVCDTPLMCMDVFPAIACPINIVFVCLFGVKRYGHTYPVKTGHPGHSRYRCENTLIKECEQEACIPADIPETACHVSSEVIDASTGVASTLPLPPEFKLRMGEVQEFYLYSMDKVKEVLVSDDFKPNCAMVVLDFIGHSFIQPDTGLYQYINDTG